MRSLVCFLLVAAACYVQAELTDDCLACMCYASSNGCHMPEQVCQNNGWGEVCGPWSITKAYWLDAGEPGGEYYTCVADWKCNEDAVRGYLGNFVPNPYATCETYARTHAGGPWGMDADYATAYWKQVKDCLDYGLFTPPP